MTSLSSSSSSVSSSSVSSSSDSYIASDATVSNTNVIIDNGIRVYKRKGLKKLELPNHKDIKLEGYSPHPPIKAELSI